MQSSHFPILIFLLRTKSKTLRLLVAQNWHTLVDPQDRGYIGELLNDFKLRAGTDDEALLKQVSSLSVGPLVTHLTGARLEDYPELDKLSHSFTDV